MIAFCLIIDFFQNFQDMEHRPLLPRLRAGLWAHGDAGRGEPGGAADAGVLPAAALVLFAVGYQFVATKDHVLMSATTGVTAFNNILWQRGPSKPHEKAGLYRRIQGSIPPGERVLVMLNHTHLLDGKRTSCSPSITRVRPGPNPGRHVSKGRRRWSRI